MSPKPATESNAVNKSLELANNLLKLSGTMVLFGYISLRARMNRLGIAAPDVPVDRYLMEAYNLLAYIFFTAGYIFLKVCVALSGIGLIVRLVRPRVSFLRAAGISRIPDRVYLLFASAVLAFLEHWIPKTLGGVPDDVLVKPACCDLLQPVRFATFLLIIGAYAAATGALWAVRGLPMRGGWRMLRIFALILTVPVGLQLPLLYGFAVQDYTATAVSVKPKSPAVSDRSCGLLVSDTASLVTVWVPSQHRLVQFPRADLEGIRLGPVIKLAEAAKPETIATVCKNLNQ
jgi:hypothetical protein